MPKESKPATKRPAKPQNPLVKIYLVAYNALSTVGWGYVLALLIIHLFDLDGKSTTYAVGSQTKAAGFFARLLPFFHSGPGGAKSAVHASLPPPLAPIYERATTAYARLGKTTTIVQSFAILEVVHALLGWVRSPVTTTAMQVASRLFLVWGITENFPSVHTNPIFASMVFAWSFTEVIRYTFYALNLVGLNPYPLLWLRYTTFYALYPLGAGSEAFLTLATLPAPVASWGPLEYVRAGLFVIWWPGLYIMYTYMISQRRKTLRPNKAKAA